MGVKLSELVNDRKWFSVQLGEFEVKVAYRPNAVTMPLVFSLEGLDTESTGPESVEAIIDLLVVLVGAWNLEDADGEMVPITRETLSALPLKLLLYIIAQLKDVVTLDLGGVDGAEKKISNGNLDAGLSKKDRLASARSGIPSSGRRSSLE